MTLFSAVSSFRLIGAVAVPFVVAGGIAWFWSIASSAGQAEAEIAALVAVNEANRAVAVKTAASRTELAKIARESSAQARTRARRIVELEASLARARAAAPASADGACPVGCRLPQVDWPWSE